MHIILLSGGSGYRLWPLSTPSLPKQFLQLLLPLDGTSTKISMLQRIWHQLSLTDLSSRAIISTSQPQASLVYDQLGSSTPLSLEPSSRDTYPAILLSTLYLLSQENMNPNEIIIVMPVDTYVDSSFFTQLDVLASHLRDSTFSLGLIGITPSCASEKFGYILPKTPNMNSIPLSSYQVKQFIEKPPLPVAEKLINDGAFWNAGVFGFKLKFLLDHLKANHLPLSYTKLLAIYDKLPKISFDFAVVEKTSDILMIPYSGKWNDLGTWNTLSEKLESDIIGNGHSYSCQETQIINTLDIPIYTLGTTDTIVVASPNGILICDKTSSSQLKEMIQVIQNNGGTS